MSEGRLCSLRTHDSTPIDSDHLFLKLTPCHQTATNLPPNGRDRRHINLHPSLVGTADRCHCRCVDFTLAHPFSLKVFDRKSNLVQREVILDKLINIIGKGRQERLDNPNAPLLRLQPHKLYNNMDREATPTEGIEYELTEFLLMATQDELNAANAIQDEIDANKRFMNLFSNDEPVSEDVAGDTIDAVLSASSFVAGWINKPGCPSGEYGRTITPDGNEHAEVEQQLKGVQGVLSWRDVTDHVLSGLGFKSADEKDGTGDAMIGLNTPLEASTSKSAEEEATRLDPPSDANRSLEDESIAEKKTKKGAQDMPIDARDDLPARDLAVDGSERSNGPKNSVVIELVEKCLESNNTSSRGSPPVQQENKSKKSKKKARSRASSADTRDDFSVPREIPAVVSTSERSGGSKNDVILKLAAKCLARNKMDQTRRFPLEPDSYLGEHSQPDAFFEEVQQNNIYSHPYAFSGQADLEARDPPIGPDICRDPPEISEMGQLLHPRHNLHEKWYINNVSIAAADVTPTGHIHQSRPEIVSTLHIDTTPTTPVHYAQPPRPETPFHADEDTSRCMKKLAKCVHSPFRHAYEETKENEPRFIFSNKSTLTPNSDAAKSAPSKESILSPSAMLRRRHYKEMLLKERAAKSAAIE